MKNRNASLAKVNNCSTENISSDTQQTLFFENRKDESESLVSTKELAKKLTCSESYVKKLKAKNIIFPEIYFGRFIRYRFSTVVTSLKKRGLMWVNLILNYIYKRTELKLQLMDIPI